jgi:hypothetical protein
MRLKGVPESSHAFQCGETASSGGEPDLIIAAQPSLSSRIDPVQWARQA